MELEIFKGQLAAHGAYAPGSARRVPQAETFAIDCTWTASKHCDDICSRTEDLILRFVVLSSAPKTSVAKVRQFMEQMLELMKCFDFLSSVMSRMEQQDEETIKTSKKDAEY